MSLDNPNPQELLQSSVQELKTLQYTSNKFTAVTDNLQLHKYSHAIEMEGLFLLNRTMLTRG